MGETVAIIGASGYGGVQLVRLLMDHPNAEMTYLGGNASVGKPLTDLYPHLGQTTKLRIEPVDILAISQRAKTVFLSLPTGSALGLVPELSQTDCRIIDLSADYRFRNLDLYEHWYGTARSDRALATQSVYGLPELYRNRIAAAQLVACPGCYPTASLLALAPLLKQGFIDARTIIIDIKSGTSVGGRRGKIHLLQAEADNSVGAYGVAHHHHTPEIEQICEDLLGQEVMVQFTPHLVPMPRGTLATVYANLRDPGLVSEDLSTIYSAFYRASPWIKILPSGVYPQTKWANGTNLCYIGIEVDERTGRVIVMAAIDNLIKGQSGQAVQCFNLMMGWEETLGLPQQSFYP
jgi:N-acetyl-gamma-glutamyl-phosphate reductase